MRRKWSGLFGGDEIEIPDEPKRRGTPTTVTHTVTTSMRLITSDASPRVEVVMVDENGSSVVIGFNSEGLDTHIKGLQKMQRLLVASDAEAPLDGMSLET